QNIPVIWGGYHPSILPRQTINSPYVDIAVKGRGEETIVKLVDAICSGKPLEKINGIVFKEKGKTVETPDAEIKDINSTRPMDYSLIKDMERYIVKTHYAERVIDYISSYGCPFNCGFCSEIKVHKRRWSGLKAERIVREIKQLIRSYKINGIRFADSNFFVDKNRVKEFSEILLKEKINIKWGNVNGRTEQLVKFEDDLWGLMKRAGLSDLLIGAEAADQKLLDFINKRATIEDTIKLKKIAHRHNLTLFVSLMIGIPFNIKKNPDEATKKQLNGLLDLIERLSEIDNRHYISIFIYTPFPGSPLYDVCLQNGVSEPQSLEEWSKINLNETNLPWVSQKYVDIVDQLQGFVFLYTTFLYDNFKDSKFKPIHLLFRKSAEFRLRHRFFAFPIEYKVLQYFFKKYIDKKFGLN
ncbi:MAG: radical SAM protein, partial [archaeon]